jgi:tRNA (mo5U34)-methyltransferase
MYSKAELEQMAESAGLWWHSIDLGQGVVTPGKKSARFLAKELQSLRLPDLRGKTVLDIGAFSGFYSFEAERRGAARVVALDHYVWSIDIPRYQQYCAECAACNTTPLAAEHTPHWQPDRLPGKRPFDVAHQVLGSKVEAVAEDFMAMDVARLGAFDVVLFLGVLYHMDNPLGALRRVARATKELAVIETHAVAVPGYEKYEICELYSASQLNSDPSNWWGPNLKALEGMCRAAGFSRVQIVHVQRSTQRNRWWRALSPIKRPWGFRAVVHAYK